MAGPSWTQRSDRPIVWHAERCVNQDLADRILELSNATAQAQTPFEGVARIHQILEQGDPALVLIRRLLARRTQLPLANFEPTYVLEYPAGHRCGIGQAMPHHDWNCPSSGAQEGPRNPNDADPTDGQPGCEYLRLVTSLVYLNTVPAGWGGATVLPRAGLRADARKGSCFLWFNARRGAGGEIFKEARAQHLGECVRAPPNASRAELEASHVRKYVLVTWIRASRYESACYEEDPDSCVAADKLRAAIAEESEAEDDDGDGEKVEL